MRAWWMLSLATVVACAPKPAPPEPAEPAPAAPVAAPTTGSTPLGAVTEAASPPAENGDTPRVELDGVLVDVRWDDGDTFSYTDAGTGKKVRARMVGYNTLESYGPVHRWGEWTGWELYDLAKGAQHVAMARAWACHDTGGEGGYGRVAVSCPGLRQELVRTGLAHVFEIDGTPDPEDLALQAAAIAEGAGMWAKGAPTGLVTSLHSADEGDGGAYNRVCDLVTGMCPGVDHDDTYDACEEVCLEGGSCMIYVPYSARYGADRAACLRR